MSLKKYKNCLYLTFSRPQLSVPVIHANLSGTMY